MIRKGDRGTGRTTLMLSAAIQVAATGRTAHVIAASKQHAGMMLAKALKLIHGTYEVNYTSADVLLLESGGQIRFLSYKHPAVSVYPLAIEGVQNRDEIFVDHFARDCYWSEVRAANRKTQGATVENHHPLSV